VAAEAGWPTAALVLVTVGGLLVALWMRLRRAPEALELAVLTSLLTAVAASALVWFPLQAPASALPALLAAGRAWRLLGAPLTSAPVPVAATARSAWSAIAGDRLARALAAALIVAGLWPEIWRYAGERHLRRAVVALLQASALPAEARPALLAQAIDEARQALRYRPYDHRPWLASGSALLLGRQAEAARRACLRALECEERPEILLNLGRAYAVLDRRPEALAAFVRAVWFNPEFLAELPAAARPLVRQRIAGGEPLLRAGRLWGPPPLPEAAPLTGPADWAR
jgi:tetratricopeptide (TPR) repeat protein